MKARTEPPPLPEALRGEPPITKFLYFWLEPQGEVHLSTRQIAEATGTSQPTVWSALKRLRELGLVEDLGERRERVQPTYRTVQRGTD